MRSERDRKENLFLELINKSVQKNDDDDDDDEMDRERGLNHFLKG
jgi:hypothetical protein